MAERRPLVVIDGQVQQLPTGDTLPGGGGGSGGVISTFRYWRLRITTPGTQTASLSTIAEIQMRESVGGADVTTGGTATASQNDFGSVAANAFDKNSATWWGSDTVPSGNTVWIQYDFGVGNEKWIAEYTVQARSGGESIQAPRGFVLEYSINGSAWIPVDTQTGLSAWSNGQIRTFTNGTPQPSAITKFTELTDTPTAYTGQEGKFVAVNAGATALEFVAPPAGGGGSVAIEDEGTEILATASRINFTGAGVTVTDAGSGEATITIPGAPAGVTTFTGLSDTPATYTGHGNKLVAVKPDASGLEFLTANDANPPRGFAATANNQNTVSTVFAQIIFQNEIFDTDNGYNPATGTFTVPASLNGKMMIFQAGWRHAATGGTIYLQHNGVNIAQANSNASRAVVVSRPIIVETGDTINVWYFVNSTLLIEAPSTFFSGFVIAGEGGGVGDLKVPNQISVNNPMGGISATTSATKGNRIEVDYAVDISQAKVTISSTARNYEFIIATMTGTTITTVLYRQTVAGTGGLEELVFNFTEKVRLVPGQLYFIGLTDKSGTGTTQLTTHAGDAGMSGAITQVALGGHIADNDIQGGESFTAFGSSYVHMTLQYDLVFVASGLGNIIAQADPIPFAGFRVRKNAQQTMGVSVTTEITWQTEDFDTHNGFASNRFTVPHTLNGKYGNFYCALNFTSANATAALYIQRSTDGGTNWDTFCQVEFPSEARAIGLTGPVLLTTGHVWRLAVFVGGAIVLNNVSSTFFSMTVLDPGVVLPGKQISHKTISGAYTLLDSDLIGNVYMTADTSGGTCTITIPDTLVGTEPVLIERDGNNNVLFAAGGTSVIRSADSYLKLRSNYSVASIIPKGGNVYSLSGDLTL